MAERRHDETCPRCGRRGIDLRGTIAIMAVLLTFGLAFTQLLIDYEDGTTIAPWAAGFLVLAVNNYYNSKGAERMVNALTTKSGTAGERQDAGRETR